MKDVSMNRLAKLYDCATHQSILPKINILAERHHVDLSQWVQQSLEYSIVFDNVDIMMRPRRESSVNCNKMHHMVQAIAVQERVKNVEKSPPLISIDEITPADVMVTSSDEKILKDIMVEQVKKMIAQCPGLAAVKVPLANEEHEYSEAMTKKSPMVRLKQPVIIIITLSNASCSPSK